MFGDASTAQSNAMKLGPGRLRHLEKQDMFIKEVVRTKQACCVKVSGKTHVVDLLTKNAKLPLFRELFLV
jgi:hypothetical protein